MKALLVLLALSSPAAFAQPLLCTAAQGEALANGAEQFTIDLAQEKVTFGRDRASTQLFPAPASAGEPGRDVWETRDARFGGSGFRFFFAPNASAPFHLWVARYEERRYSPDEGRLPPQESDAVPYYCERI